MILHTTEVKALPNYHLFIRFNNGAAGEINLAADLYGEIFEPLRNPSVFATAKQHPLMRTVTWANGADFAPEYLYELMESQQGQRVA